MSSLYQAWDFSIATAVRWPNFKESPKSDFHMSFQLKLENFRPNRWNASLPDWEACSRFPIPRSTTSSLRCRRPDCRWTNEILWKFKNPEKSGEKKGKNRTKKKWPTKSHCAKWIDRCSWKLLDLLHFRSNYYSWPRDQLPFLQVCAPFIRISKNVFFFSNAADIYSIYTFIFSRFCDYLCFCKEMFEKTTVVLTNWW